MKCLICKNGETRPGKVTITLERNGATIIVKEVPAQICGNCGEEYVDDGTTDRVMRLAQQSSAPGVQVEIRQYVAA
jgi:YgiT-type zinc finger domain-containing protein